jgi:hypothetical protein
MDDTEVLQTQHSAVDVTLLQNCGISTVSDVDELKVVRPDAQTWRQEVRNTQ